MSWPEIRQSGEFAGQWVALDNCKYDAKTAEPVEGVIVDADADLVELCTRIKQGENKHCAILFCDEHEEPSVSPSNSHQRAAPTSPTTH